MSKLNKMNEMAIQQLTGFYAAYSGDHIDGLVISMGLGVDEWRKIKPQVIDWLPKKLVDEIDEHFSGQEG